MKLKPIIWGYKLKDGTQAVKIRISSGNSTKYHPIGVSVKKDQWDKRAGRVKNHPSAPDYNRKIMEVCNSIERNFLSNDTPETGNKNDFYWWFSERLAFTKAKHGLYNWKKLNNVQNKLKAFAPRLQVAGLTTKFLSDFETHLLKTDHPNYVADTLTRVRIIVRTIVNAGALDYHKNPFLTYKLTKKRSDRKRLTLEHIQKLEQLKGLTEVQELARDMYIFSFYAGGIRFGDLCRLDMNCIHGDRLKYVIHKTDIEKNIRLHPTATRIFKKYGYRFPVVIDWQNEDQSINSENSRLNRYLKKACGKAGIEKITFHTARHSVADYAVKKKLSTKQLQGIFGHRKAATTEIYLKTFYQEESDEAMDQLFD